MPNHPAMNASNAVKVVIAIIVIAFTLLIVIPAMNMWVVAGNEFLSNTYSTAPRRGWTYNPKVAAELKTLGSGFVDSALEMNNPGYSNRYLTSASHGIGGVAGERSLQNRTDAAQASVAAKSGLTGSRQEYYFPEGSLYNIEGKMRETALAGGTEGFHRGRKSGFKEFDPTDLENKVYG
jgi:hypothetical protein